MLTAVVRRAADDGPASRLATKSPYAVTMWARMGEIEGDRECVCEWVRKWEKERVYEGEEMERDRREGFDIRTSTR